MRVSPATFGSSRWPAVLLASVIACLSAYGVDLALFEVHAGSTWGRAYGGVATFLLAAALLFGIRRRTTRVSSRYRLGSSRTWLRLHTCGGTLFLLLVLMHSGFGIPSGTFMRLLLGLSIWTALSGIAGWALQQWIPRALTSGLATEVHAERIPELVAEIRRRAEEILLVCAEPIRAFYTSELAASLSGSQPRWIYFIDITGGIGSRLKKFDYLRERLTSEQKTDLDELQRLFVTKQEIDAHQTLQRALRWWLYLHVPVSLVLVALVGVHVFSVFYY